MAALGDTANTIEEIIVWLPSRESRLSRLLCEASERISAAERLLRESDGYGGG